MSSQASSPPFPCHALLLWTSPSKQHFLFPKSFHFSEANGSLKCGKMTQPGYIILVSASDGVPGVYGKMKISCSKSLKSSRWQQNIKPGVSPGALLSWGIPCECTDCVPTNWLLSVGAGELHLFCDSDSPQLALGTQLFGGQFGQPLSNCRLALWVAGLFHVPCFPLELFQCICN